MENTDSTVISTSLPMIAETLGTDPIALKLALTSYLVSLAIFIPISGWMADKYGARTIFTAAIGVFMAGSLACAASTSLEWFVIARFAQGIGGAMMVPVGRLVLLRSVPRSEVVQALATLTIPALVGPIIGPPLGGFITTYFHWRWIFFINIPIGILGIVMAMLLRAEHQGRRYAAPRHHRLPSLRLRLRPAHARLRHRRAASDPGRDLRRLRDRRRDLPRSLCLPRAAHARFPCCSSAF